MVRSDSTGDRDPAAPRNSSLPTLKGGDPSRRDTASKPPDLQGQPMAGREPCRAVRAAPMRLRKERMRLRKERMRLRKERMRLRKERVPLREEGVRLQEERARLRKGRVRLRGEPRRWQEPPTALRRATMGPRLEETGSGRGASAATLRWVAARCAY
jgi:hypothetical protein